MDVKVTEVSLSLKVAGAIKTHVGKEMPFVVNTTTPITSQTTTINNGVVCRGVNVERVLPCDRGEGYPWWIQNPPPDAVRLIYSCPLQDVECSYSKPKSVIYFHGIKYKNMDKFNWHISSVLSMLGVEPVGATTTRYKAVAKADINVPWEYDVVADIITNDPEMAQVMAMCERMSTLGTRRLFSAVIDVGGGDICRVALTHTNNQMVAMMSKLPDEDASLRAADVLKMLIEKYEAKWDNVQSPAASIDSAVNGIKALREILPELFIHNYTRECPVLPIMVPEPPTHDLNLSPTLSPLELPTQDLNSSPTLSLPKSRCRVIKYPANGIYARYYTAPEGYFVGLKRNRLANKDIFPCLVTCYLQDHMERKGSETYSYYAANVEAQDEETTKISRKKPLPKSISNPNYHRRRAASFRDAVELATGVKIDKFPWCPQVVKQELWDRTDDDIMATINRGTEGSCVYRYFEEVVGVSIHVVVIIDGNFESLVPRHKGRYVWSPPYPLHIVIFETYKTTYGSRSCCYDYLTKGTATMFDEEDSVVSYLTTQKAAESLPPAKHGRVNKQVIDRNGKCCRVILDDSRQQSTFTRPMAVPIVPEPICFFDFHVRKMNAAKQEMGIGQVDLSKRSNNDVLYFPNNFSFERYVKINSNS